MTHSNGSPVAGIRFSGAGGESEKYGQDEESDCCRMNQIDTERLGSTPTIQ